VAEIRSTSLAFGGLPAANNYEIVRCPAGLTLLVKTIILFNASTLDSQINMTVFSGTNAAFVGTVLEALALNSALRIDTWIVLLPGDHIVASASGGFPVYFNISGTALHGVETIYQRPTQPVISDEPMPLPAKPPSTT
jgi:hypothetical protein